VSAGAVEPTLHGQRGDSARRAPGPGIGEPQAPGRGGQRQLRGGVSDRATARSACGSDAFSVPVERLPERTANRRAVIAALPAACLWLGLAERSADERDRAAGVDLLWIRTARHELPGQAFECPARSGAQALGDKWSEDTAPRSSGTGATEHRNQG
jgi:hypothetical protein